MPDVRSRPRAAGLPVGPALPWLALSLARAHGPAPAPLEVVLWGGQSACDAVPSDTSPSLVRTNIGLARLTEEGTYVYDCPARWGDEEQALAAGTVDRQVLLAGSTRVWWSRDEGCTAVPLALEEGEVPIDLEPFGAAVWLATRSFDRGTSTLWWVDQDGLEARWTSSDRFLDGVVVDRSDLWLGGARSEPFLVRWDLASGEDEVVVTLPAHASLDRLAPRAPDGDDLYAVASGGGMSWLWWVEDGVGVEVIGPATVLHGPVRLPSGPWLAEVDGVLWVGEGADWQATDQQEDWTCLRMLQGRPYACSLTGLRSLAWQEDRVQATLIFGLEQLGPPDPTCDDVLGACELDWSHFGGESGFLETVPATCPGEARSTPAEEAPEGCACAQGPAPRSWAWLLPLVGFVGGLRRRRA